ncbi:UDP-N-acetylmuramoyl-L-alanine--D-glutamate ligase [Nonomuraea sp. NN258]|uniref:UDP-N-acetylmuramoyl-L-alanine--D-glutamate ligase n=1 Tax=Nonomuraea antri TaxID=2730852 RepID=UPI001567E001|nr:UDP-N-acetylmuramoyl-L-alanine--D-glutamate ligase [Nonomuraea antri]NRQ36559.1 UDP-N-acetylmuramoyl-L-alanine--D-glutamate ligase [Nonomuraea antri]
MPQVSVTCVAGLGVSGTAVAKVLAGRGERVVVVEAVAGERQLAAAAELARVGVETRFGAMELPEGVTRLVTTGWAPHHPLIAAALARGVEVVGEVELAWRLRPPQAAPWLALTGTNGKTTAVRMLTSILLAAGRKALAVGNVGVPVVRAVGEPYDVLAVELSSFQLHWSSTLAPHAAAVLNVAPDHLDWHGSMAEYAAAKGRIYERAGTVIFNADDPESARLAEGHPGAVGFTLRVPRSGQLGVVEDLLVDRAFVADPVEAAEELATLADIRPLAPHNVANALAAAALARSFGVPAESVRQGLRDFVPDPHRMSHVDRVGEVDYVDDSKATNPHAAEAALASYPSIVWVAGGQLKGADVGELVRRSARRLRGCVLLGADRARIAEALARHAPNVPVVDIPDQDTGVMDRVVTEAARLASPGDTVLLSPAGASLDMFPGYPARGEAFARAVHELRRREREH